MLSPTEFTKDVITLKERVISFFVYVIILFFLRWILLDKIAPTGGNDDIWFISAISMIAFTIVLSPYFVKPRDSLVNSFAASLLLWSLDFSNVNFSKEFINTFRWISFSLTITTFITASSSILLQKTDPIKSPLKTYLNKFCYRISTSFGKAELVYTLPALISIVGFYEDRPNILTILGLLWIFIASVKPIETILNFINDIRSLNKETNKVTYEGFIQRVDSPNIVRVYLHSISSWQRTAIKIVCFADGSQSYLIPLFRQIQDEGLIGTGLCLGPNPNLIKEALPGSVYQPLDNNLDRAELIKVHFKLDLDANIIGFIVENSTIFTIKFEIAYEFPLSAGEIVFCQLENKRIFYQILDASTSEESFERNPRGTQVVNATQLGILESDGYFKRYSWLPEMNTPVFQPNDPKSLVTNTKLEDEIIIGTIPNSALSVRVGFNDLMEFHSAILGVTGTGKTELAFDIIKFDLKNNCKIFCVDFTGEYQKRLEDQKPAYLGFDSAQNEKLENLLTEIETGEYGAGKEKKAFNKFIDEIKPEIQKKIDDFLRPEESGLGIFDLPDIANTRATLRATELYLSAIFDWARKNRKARKILIVLEEAHTVIPEFNLYSYDKVDTQAVVGRMAQIALQGRKYGVGLLVISQRTALVSKTILSQCNTYFTFSLIDKTSLDYLSSIYNQDLVNGIPNLLQFQMVAYGKAVRSERPLIVQIPYDENKLKASKLLDKKIEKKETASEDSVASTS